MKRLSLALLVLLCLLAPARSGVMQTDPLAAPQGEESQPDLLDLLSPVPSIIESLP